MESNRDILLLGDSEEKRDWRACHAMLSTFSLNSEEVSTADVCLWHEGTKSESVSYALHLL